MLHSPVGEALGPVYTPRTRAGVGALGLEKVGPVAQSTPCTPALPGPLVVLRPQALGIVRVMSEALPESVGCRLCCSQCTSSGEQDWCCYPRFGAG